MTRRAARWRTAAVAGALLVLGTACAGVPNSSDPVALHKVNPSSTEGEPPVQAVPNGPTPHMSQRDVVNGFLDASSIETDNGHGVARRFLSPHGSASWHDAAQATIYTQPLVNDNLGGGDVGLTISQTATVGADGSYHVTKQDNAVVLHLVRVGGEWRIDNPPPGVYVTSSDFAQTFRQSDVYFLSRDRKSVVPDPRFFQAPAAALPNRLVQALLAGPSQWLMPAVVTDVPAGARIRNPVEDDSPAVTVDLAGLGQLSKAQLKGLSAQLVYTLSQSALVRILSDGQPLDVPGIGAEQQQADWDSYDAESLPASSPLYLIHDGAVWSIDGKPVPGGAGKAFYDLDSVATSLDGRQMAGVSGREHQDELFAGPSGHTLNRRLTARQLTPPTWGGQTSEVWTVRDGRDIIRVPVNPGQPERIAAPQLSEVAPVTQLRLSRDGARVAVVGRSGRLYVGRVARSEHSVTIDGLRRLAGGLGGFTDVTWSDGDSLIGLAPSGGSRIPWEIAVDGSTRRPIKIDALPTEPSGVAAARDNLTVVSAAGQMWYFDNSTWKRFTVDKASLRGTAPTYPD